MRHNPDQQPPLFDEAALASRRARSWALGFAGAADFLHREVAGIVAERLAEITRPFLDVAVFGAGAGDLGRAIAGAERQVQQFELSPQRAAASGAENLLQREVLPLAPGSVDLIVSSFELHWANDPVGQLIQMRRALRPDGLVLAALFGGQTLAELRSALAEAEAEIAGGLSPRVAPMGEIRALGGLLQRAGLAMPVADSERIEVTYADPLALMRDLRAMGETSILADRPRGMLRRDVLMRACEIYAAHFSTPEGRVRATFEIVFLTGWAPAPDQPPPLRPGSAQARLSDALQTREVALPDKAGGPSAGPSTKKD